MVREMQIEEAAEKDRQKLLMPEGERQELIAALKKKWECLHIEYQQQTHYTKYDTLGKKNRNEALMREMDQIESDIKKLSKNYIFVDTTQPSSMW
jgi:vacuolar-type H+-ATPase catalytic subunit A/Vma1